MFYFFLIPVTFGDSSPLRADKLWCFAWKLTALNHKIQTSLSIIQKKKKKIYVMRVNFYFIPVNEHVSRHFPAYLVQVLHRGRFICQLNPDGHTNVAELAGLHLSLLH